MKKIPFLLLCYHLTGDSYVGLVFPKASGVKSSFWRGPAQLKTSGTLGDLHAKARSHTRAHMHTCSLLHILRANTNSAHGRVRALLPHYWRETRWGTEKKIRYQIRGTAQARRRGSEEGGRKRGQTKRWPEEGVSENLPSMHQQAGCWEDRNTSTNSGSSLRGYKKQKKDYSVEHLCWGETFFSSWFSVTFDMS